jgi:hypothetical protein
MFVDGNEILNVPSTVFAAIFSLAALMAG